MTDAAMLESPVADALPGPALHITAAVSTWRTAFGLFQTFIEKRATIPMLEHVQLRVSTTGLPPTVTLAGTNLDSLVIAKLGSNVINPIPVTPTAFLVPFRPVDRLLQTLIGDRLLTMTFADSHLVITPPGGDPDAFAAYRFPLMVADDDKPFTGLADSEFPEPINLAPGHDTPFREAIRKASAFVSTEETRYYLNGVYMDCVAEGGPYAVATDGHRMGRWPLGIAPLPWPKSPIVHHSNLRFISDHNGLTAFAYNPARNRIRFTWPDFALEAKTIDGTYPDWTKVNTKAAAPENVGARVIVDQVALRRVIERLATMYGPYIGIIANPPGSRFLVFGNGNAVETIEAGILESASPVEPTFNAFNAVYLKSMIDVLNGQPKVVLSLSKNGKEPSLIGTEADPGLMVIMPMVRMDALRDAMLALLALDPG